MSDQDALRLALEKLLNGGLETEIEPRAYEHETVLGIVTRLQEVEADDFESKLRIAGFTLNPYGDDDDEQACETCMYYKTHQRYCELPELMLPVEPAWSCRLWRI